MASNLVQLFEVGDLDQIANVLLDVNGSVYKDGKRPLHLAALYGHAHIVSWLLLEDADVNTTDQGGHTPLHLAAKYGHEEVVQLLLQHGANVNAANKSYKMTPLHMAAKEGQRGAAEMLIKGGADVNLCAKDGVHPLHICAEKGHREVAAVLIRAGASPNLKDKIGWTPLHLSIENKQESMVALLLKLGADPDTPNKNGWTALHLAANNGSTAAVRALLEYGADLAARTSTGKTPQDLAIEQQHASVVPLLNPAAAAQLAHPYARASSTISSMQGYEDDPLAPAAGNDLHSIESLLGGLGLKDSVEAACPYCSMDAGSFLNPGEGPNPAGAGGASFSSAMSSFGGGRSSSSSSGSSSSGVPSLFVCPLSHKVLTDPVVACDGFTYDKRAIQDYFETGQRVSPLTKQPLRSTAVLPNHVVRCAVSEWLEWRDKRVQHLLRQQQRQR